MKHVFLFAAILLIFVAGCREADYTNPFNADDTAENIPVIVSVSGTYTFNVNASNFNLDRNDPLSIVSDSIVITISITMYKSGSCNISINNDSGNQLFTEYSNGNKSIVLLKNFNSKPSNVIISMKNLTAQVAIVLAVKK